MRLARAAEAVCGEWAGTGQAWSSRRRSKESLGAAFAVVADSVATTVDANSSFLVARAGAVVAVAGFGPSNQVKNVSTVEVVMLELAPVTFVGVLTRTSGVLDRTSSLLNTIRHVGSHFTVFWWPSNLERDIFQAGKPDIWPIVGSDEDSLDILECDHEHRPSHGNLRIVYLIPCVLVNGHNVGTIGRQHVWVETQEDAVVPLEEHQGVLAKHGVGKDVLGVALDRELQLSIVGEDLISKEWFGQGPVQGLVQDIWPRQESRTGVSARDNLVPVHSVELRFARCDSYVPWWSTHHSPD